MKASGVFFLVDDPSLQVRLQLAASLGSWSAPDAGEALAKLATRSDNDKYTKAAIVSSLPPHYETLCRAALSKTQSDTETNLLDALLLMGESRPKQLAQLLQELLNEPTDLMLRFDVTARWLDRLADRKQSFASLCEKHEPLSIASNDFSKLVNEARQICVEATRNTPLRAAAIGLLGREPENNEADVSVLTGLLAPQEPQAVQMAAIDRLSHIPTGKAAEAMLQNWSSYLPQQQQRVAAALLARADWSLTLLDAIDDGTVQPHDLSLAQQQSLRESRDKRVAARADEVFAGFHSGSRSELTNSYAEQLVVGNTSHGRSVFDANCKVCHTLDRDKTPVGPDLRSLTNRSRTALLSSILDPSQSIEPKFANYSVVLQNGEVLGGVIVTESESSLTLLDSEGKRREILRNSIELTKRTQKSLMPEGFETKITPAKMSDLIAFLREL